MSDEAMTWLVHLLGDPMVHCMDRKCDGVNYYVTPAGFACSPATAECPSFRLLRCPISIIAMPESNFCPMHSIDTLWPLEKATTFARPTDLNWYMANAWLTWRRLRLNREYSEHDIIIAWANAVSVLPRQVHPWTRWKPFTFPPIQTTC